MTASLRQEKGGYDPCEVGRAFSQAAASYDRHATIQRQVAGDLAADLALLCLPAGGKILEIGCGTGLVTRALWGHSPDWRDHCQWMLSDMAPLMVRQAITHLESRSGLAFFAACDVHHLPFRDGYFDLIYGSLVLQWVSDLRLILDRLASLLVPGGRFFVTLFGVGSFRQWHEAHDAYSLQKAGPVYCDPHSVHSLWPKGGRGRVSLTNHHHTYPDALGFLQELRGLGATTPSPDYIMLKGGRLRALLRSLPQPFPVSYQIVTLAYRHSFAPCGRKSG